MKKPSYPSKGALLLKRKRVGATGNENEAPGGKQTGTCRSLRRNKENRKRSPKRHGNVRDHLGPPQPMLQQRYSPRQYTPLTASVSHVLHEVQHEKFMRWPSQVKSDPTKRDNTKYCEFHRDHGHRTDDCIQPRKEIEYLIRRRHLRRYVALEG